MATFRCAVGEFSCKCTAPCPLWIKQTTSLKVDIRKYDSSIAAKDLLQVAQSSAEITLRTAKAIFGDVLPVFVMRSS